MQPQSWKDIFVRMAPLGAAVILAIGGVWVLYSEETAVLSERKQFLAVTLISAALILLGSWLTTEVWNNHSRDRLRVHEDRGEDRASPVQDSDVAED